jgi:hypothetical protein
MRHKYYMIYLIITTSINNKNGIKDFEHRKFRYIDSIKSSLSLINGDNTIKPIIIENNGYRQTYLDGFGCEVAYSNNNTLNLKHKGANELIDIHQLITHYNIQDDDMIIKLTGRYKLLNLDFINCVKTNITKYDAFVKFFNVCTLEYLYNDCVLGLFAIKCKYLKQFDYKCVKSPECEFAEYVRDFRVMEIDKLGLECCFADDHRILHV